jgi:signal transduction histidine kinase
MSLRLRITAGALAVVVAVSCAGGLLLIRVVEREMLAQVDATLTANADYIDRSIRSGDPLPTGEGPTDLYVQFLAADGSVAGASTAAQDRPPLAEPLPGAERRIVTEHDDALGPLRVLVQPAPTDATTTLAVARSARSVGDVRSLLMRMLVVTVAVAGILIGVLVWVVVGRALRPVEAMRKAVHTISERDLQRRIDRPGTGDELERLADTLNDLLDRLDRAVTRERQFVADASHELRSPIAGVRALLETEPTDPAAVVGVRAEALARLGHLQDMVEHLLVLSRNDEGCGPPKRPVDLDDLVLGQARQLTRMTNLRVDTSQVSGGQVVGRDTDLARVIENLAANAARHARTTVAFAVRQLDGVVELAVIDDGPGIAAADRGRIFERFTTLDDARSLGQGGTGLGLSIASAIVAAHHGTIRADDAPGAGARFVVRLPAEAPEVPVETTEAELASGRTSRT